MLFYAILTNISTLIWVGLGRCRCPWVSVGQYKLRQVNMRFGIWFGVYGYGRICKDMGLCVQKLLGVYSYGRMSMDVVGCMWIWLGVYGNVWVCIDTQRAKEG